MLRGKKRQIKITDESLISYFWFKYAPHWPLFLLMLVLFIGCSWLYLRFSTPVYESSAAIIIKDKQKGLDDSKMMEALNQLSTKKIIENEIEIIKSRTLMSEVVRNLHLYAPVFERGHLTSTSAYTTSPVSIEADQPDALIDVPEVNFTFNKKANSVAINGQSYPLNTWVLTEYGKLRFTAHNTASLDGRQFYFSLVNPKKVTQDLLTLLEVVPAVKLSSVVRLKIKDEVPKRSEDILNGLIKAYNKAAVNDRNTLAANTLTFVEERLNYVARDLDSIERKLQNYKANKGAIDISSQGRLYLESVSSNDQKLGDLNTQLAVLDKVEQYVSSKNNSNKGGIVPSTIGVTDPRLEQLLDKLYESELQYERLKQTTAQNNPLLITAYEQVEKIKPGILENIQNQRRSLQASRNNLYSINGHYSSMLQTIPRKERTLVEISREQTIKSNIYTFLLQKREEIALAYSSTTADSRLVDAAESSLKPVSPKPVLVYALSVALAIALCIVIIAGKETFQQTISSRQEIESFTSVPVIGEIPFEKSGGNIVIGESKRTFAAEQFRKLRTSRYFSATNPKKRKLLVTSTLPGEGKSFIVANLGLSLALTGKKVVLLEFDLNNPTLGKKLNVAPGYGISEYLNGEAEPEEIIKRTDRNENLFLIQAGNLPENGSELVSSSRVRDLLQYLDGIFDFVIIDTPPVGLLSDAFVLASYCDAILYVVRHNYTPKVLVQGIDENNRNNELKNIALVFNGVKPGRLSKDSYGYNYAHKYIQQKKGLRKGRLV